MLALGISAASSYGWGVLGRVKCPEEALLVQGAVVSVSGSTALGAFTASGTTDVNGEYFIDLPDAPGTWVATLDLNTIPAGSSVIGSGAVAFETTVADGTRRVDFRLENCSNPPPLTGCIGNFVWNDLNGNGRQDAGEPGIAGVTVTLLDVNGDVVDTTVTDANGFYLFEDLTLGEYSVEVTTPAGFDATTANAAGVSTELDSDQSGVDVVIDETTRCDYTIDFGFVEPPTPPSNPGTGTPGYWKNHPEAWPVDQIEIGGVVYTKAQAIAHMKNSGKGDKTYTMFMHLVCAILNVEIGNDDSCISQEIIDADAWMTAFPLGSKVAGDSDAWELGEPLKNELDAYNNGLLCAPHRD